MVLRVSSHTHSIRYVKVTVAFLPSSIFTRQLGRCRNGAGHRSYAQGHGFRYVDNIITFSRPWPLTCLAAFLVDTLELAGNTIVYLTQKRQEWLAGRYISVNWDMEELFKKKDEIVEKDLLRVRMAIE